MNILQDCFDYVNAHESEFIAELGEICACRSVAGDKQGLESARTYLLDKLSKTGISSERLDVEGGNAIIYGQCTGKKERTILFYNHYDVVEEGKKEGWITRKPFLLTEKDGVLYARGVSDNKGALMARIHAIQTVLETTGSLPVNIKFIIEGDEESASPSMFRYQREHTEEFREKTKADICFWENGRIDKKGCPWARFGVRGNCSFNLKVTTSNTDVHGRMGAMVPSASWRLIWALASLKDSNEKILIDGFYDDVQPPTQKELEILRKFPYEEESVKKRLDLKEFLLNARGEELKKRIYFEPTLSICGLEAGELFNGPRGIVPHTAYARISFYLVADQNPEKVYCQLQEHLCKHGFSDIKVEFLGGSVPVKTPTDIPVTKQLCETAALVYDKPMVIELTQLGAGPAIAFRRAWPDIPIIGVGPANTGANHHAPDENITIDDYKKAVKHMIAFMLNY